MSELNTDAGNIRHHSNAAVSVFFALLVTVFPVSRAEATGYPVFDISNFLESIDQLYAIYEQIENGVEQVQNLYTQIEAQAKQVASFDWSNVGDSASDLGNTFKEAFQNKSLFEALSDKQKILATQKSIKTLTSTVSSDIDLYNSLSNKLDNETVSVNGHKYSVAGLFGLGSHSDNNAIQVVPNIWSDLKEIGQDEANNWAGNLSYADRAAISRKYGISPQVYFEQRIPQEVFLAKAQKLIGKDSDAYKVAQENSAKGMTASGMALITSAEDSTNKRLEGTALILGGLSQNVNDVNSSIGEVAGMLGAKAYSEQVDKEVEAQQREIDAENYENIISAHKKDSDYILLY